MAAPQDLRVALVTGAGSGIGRAVALALSARGYHVALFGRTRHTLEETRALALGGYERVHVLDGDVSVAASAEAAVRSTMDRFGRLDVLFNNAGTIGPSCSFEDIRASDWHHVLQTNLSGAFFMAQAAFRVMKEQDPQGGRIINNGSVSAHAPRPNSAPYAVTKHGMTGLTRCLSLDGRKYNIACGQIDVGNAATPMTDMVSNALQPNGQHIAEPTFEVRHVGEAVANMAELPLSANVQFMTLMATTMPLIGRG